MALAGLCEQLQRCKPDVYRFHAIVVNHQARPEATQEAAQVQQMLQRMGQYLTLPFGKPVCQ